MRREFDAVQGWMISSDMHSHGAEQMELIGERNVCPGRYCPGKAGLEVLMAPAASIAGH